ncbi:hypothetical protein [Polaribacter sargassicola]|uniref:hypothetical protein n=1 Tax=Polaribacter sargassicola TaxID=2836891 RepID=UPI001F3FAFD9|nr:hypothetical protein [Polaribacter sp. DS7-9]MCG1034889.1 hypothetical protein [Polaribacter sp. DS7-9]
MKKIIFPLIIFMSTVIFSQKKIVEKIEIEVDEINIDASGLDNLIIENSNSGFLEVYLQAESYDSQYVDLTENKSSVDIKFNFEGTETREIIFRKFITKRLQRADAVVKIPVEKKVNIFGENVFVEAKSVKNDLSVYIENGIVKLNKIQSNILLKLYSGNVYASINNSSVDVTSNNGKIKVDTTLYQKKYQKEILDNNNKLNVVSIRANIYLTTK